MKGNIAIADPEEAARVVHQLAQRLIDNVEKVVVGKREAIATAVAALLGNGHVLVEDAPGVAKTVLAKALARSIGLEFKRIQCTPDLLPSDVTGSSIFNPKTAEFTFVPGPIFGNLILVDELNRATPRTQASLLECMAERQTTIDNVTHRMADPFIVFATQNPFEYEGTFPLPEAQLDRFAVRMRIGYPSEDAEVALLESQRVRHPLESLESICVPHEVQTAQAAVREIHVAEEVRRYMARLVRATRGHGDILIGASPRASLALFSMSQAVCGVAGRDFVPPDVVKFLAPSVLEHRISLKPEARMRGKTAAQVVQDVVDRTPAPSIGPR